MRQYIVLNSLEDANKVIQKINILKKFPGTWAMPIQHPNDDRCLIPIDWSQLHGCETLLAGANYIDRSEAVLAGWHFGPFTGKLAREKEKMEDIHFLFDALIETSGRPNFPAFRSIVLSFLSACYSLRESLATKASLPKLKAILSDWWQERSAELEKRDELLKSFEQFMNNEKHGGPLAGQRSKLSLEPKALLSELIITQLPFGSDPNTLHISAEGAFATAFAGTPMQRRYAVGIHSARYEVTVSNAPALHLGHSIAGLSLIQMLDLIRKYYANLVFEASKLLREGPAEEPAMQFEGDQFLHTDRSSEKN